MFDDKRGVTLMELVVTIAIFMILLGFVVINIRSSNNEANLTNAGHVLASDLRRVQNMAQSGVLNGTVVPPGGYGIFFSKLPDELGHYILFADVNGNHEYDVEDAVVSSVDILPNVELLSFQIDGTPSLDSELHISFSPLHAYAFVGTENSASERNKQVCVQLKHIGTGSEFAVNLDGQSGKINSDHQCES